MSERPVTLLAAGGTIAMGRASDPGGGAVPLHDAAALLAAAGLDGVVARTVDLLPGAQRTLEYACELAHAVREAAGDGRGVVVTHGTDTLEEMAFLCDLLHDGEAPVVFTGAMRPASLPGADGPANVIDAVRAAGAAQTAGLGVLVCFAGELFAARAVRKADSVSVRPFAGGRVGRVAEDRVTITARPERRPAVPFTSLGHLVHVVGCGLGDDGTLLELAARDADGLVAVALGAGHVPPPYLDALRRAAERIPVVCTVRPERGAILHATYGFEGAERDLRASGVFCAAALTPQHARVKLLACLGAGLDRAGIAAAFASDDV